MAQAINIRMVYINKGEHDSPHENSGSLNTDNVVYTHTDFATKLLEEIEKLEYIYQHFQDCKKIHSTFSEKGDQLQNRDIIFFSRIFGPVFS